MKVFTIGFTQTSAENFFARLRAAGVKRVIDVRLNSTSQLAGFAKAADLAYFLRGLAGIAYAPEPLLAPTPAMLKAYRSGGEWDAYAAAFLALMKERRIERQLSPDLFDGGCLLCSEAKPHRYHRRLVCEYLSGAWGTNLDVTHL